MFATTASILILAVSCVNANVFLTNPTAATTMTAGQKVSLAWRDDGKAPSLAEFGPAKISIYAGNAQQQTLLQELSPSTDVSKQDTLEITPDAKIGPNSNEYFIRIESLGLKDPANPQFPALSFSAKFTLAGMSGVFSPAVQAQIAGQSTAPLAGSTNTPPTAGATTAGATGASTPATNSNKPTGASSAKPSASSARPSGNAAVAMGAVSFTSLKMWAGALVGVAVGAMIC